MTIPKYSEIFDETLAALRALGGSASIAELDDAATQLLITKGKLTEAETAILLNPERGDRTIIEYRLGWARTYLKIYGLLENSARGVWALTAQGAETLHVEPAQVMDYAREHSKLKRAATPAGLTPSEALDTELVEAEADMQADHWETQLLQILKSIEPAAFERLCQRLLREAGFSQVEVTGKSGDGGIDGKGIMKMGSLLSFHVIFQCKRYTGQVGAGAMRDFRGAMMGRADKGLFLTTGGFTRDAVKEATRDGVSPIELIDGDALCALLKSFSLGVKTELVQVENISIDEVWLRGI